MEIKVERDITARRFKSWLDRNKIAYTYDPSTSTFAVELYKFTQQQVRDKLIELGQLALSSDSVITIEVNRLQAGVLVMLLDQANRQTKQLEADGKIPLIHPDLAAAVCYHVINQVSKQTSQNGENAHDLHN